MTHTSPEETCGLDGIPGGQGKTAPCRAGTTLPSGEDIRKFLRRLRAGKIPVLEGKDRRPGLTPRNLPVAHQRSLHPPSIELLI